MVDFDAGAAAGLRGGRSSVRFEKIVGQEELKEVLLAVVANDELDGLLVRGEKGTAKSTAVRGLVELLPEQSVVADCPYGCSPTDPGQQCSDCRKRRDPPVGSRPVPLVTLPLGATRERVVGSLSVADALDGEPEFEPGLLARANRGLLYVDEVNLLDDHLVDVLLDAAASGYNRVERDGVSVRHPAEFTLVGTMNPEEGELRPQLRDRFALQATVEGCRDVSDRVAIIDRALGGDETANGSDRTRNRRESTSADDPGTGPPGETTVPVRERLQAARHRLANVELPESLKSDIAELCLDAGVEGHRADIAIARAARTFAALDGRTTVHEPDLERAAAFALPHRLQSRPFEDAPEAEKILDEHFEDAPEADDREDGDEQSPDADDVRQEAGEAKDRQQTARGDDETRSERDDTRRGEHDDTRRDEREGNGSESDGRSDGDRSEGEAGSDGRGRGTDRNGAPDRADQDTEAGRGRTPDYGRGDDDRSETPESPSADAEGVDTSSAEDRDGEESEGVGDDESNERATPLVPGTTRTAVGEGVAPEVETPETADSQTDGGSDGRVDAVPSTTADGAHVRTERSNGEAVDPAATVRAVAARGGERIEWRDLRRSVRSSTANALVVVAIDASASMRGPMRAAKGVVLELLRDVYEQRDAVAVVAFAGTDAEVVVPPTDSVTLAARHLKELPTADRTPLPAGIETTADVLERATPDVGVAVVVTDGRATAGTDRPTADTRDGARRLGAVTDHTLVVDAGDDGRGLTELLATETDGTILSLNELTPARLDRAVGQASEH